MTDQSYADRVVELCRLTLLDCKVPDLLLRKLEETFPELADRFAKVREVSSE